MLPSHSTTVAALLALLGAAEPVAGQELASLDGDWDLANGSAAKAPIAFVCLAAVPGTVPGALFRAGLGPDPTYGRNQLSVSQHFALSPLGPSTAANPLKSVLA